MTKFIISIDFKIRLLCNTGTELSGFAKVQIKEHQAGFAPNILEISKLATLL
jgi:hypothetical protein